MQFLGSLLPSLLITFLTCWVGVLFMQRVFADVQLKAQLCFGVVIGLVGLSWVGFLLALIGALTWLTIAATVAILIVAVIFLRPVIPSFSAADFSLGSFASYGCWLVFFSWLFSRVIAVETEGLFTAPANNYGDLAFHFSVVTSFADANNFPPRNPIFQGLNFTYPFLIDFLAAFFHRAGAVWSVAFFLPNVVLSMALVGLIEILTEQLTQNRLAARLTPPMFFLSGGAGFLYCVRDWQRSNVSWWNFLLHLPQSYTKNDELDLQWGNMLTTLIVPQRSLLFGIPVFAIIVLLWWQWLEKKEEHAVEADAPLHSASHFSRAYKYLLFAGILAGLMPLLHAHGFFSIMMVSVVMALVFFSWDWLAFFVPAGVLALPQALWLSSTGTKSSLFKPHLGWATGEDFPKFLALNFGLFLLLLALSLVFQRARTRRFYAPFLLCFLVPNVVLLAPWPWDNIKVLLYWYLLSCPLVAACLIQLAQKRKWLWPVTGLLLLALMASGALDVGRGLSPVEKLRLFDSAQLQVAELIKQRLPAHALVLSAPIHNSVLALSGRQMLMGYPGHLWSHGIDFSGRERDLKTMYRGGKDAERLFLGYGIDYVIVGPVEYSDFNADEGYFAEKYPVVIDEAGYRIYQIRQEQTSRQP